jgi:hypothetical protein
MLQDPQWSVLRWHLCARLLPGMHDPDATVVLSVVNRFKLLHWHDLHSHADVLMSKFDSASSGGRISYHNSQNACKFSVVLRCSEKLQAAALASVMHKCFQVYHVLCAILPQKGFTNRRFSKKHLFLFNCSALLCSFFEQHLAKKMARFSTLRIQVTPYTCLSSLPGLKCGRL